MPGWSWVLVFWVAFAGSHMIMSAIPVRRTLIDRLGGERPFSGVYSLVAAATFIPMVWIYWSSRHSGPMLWDLRAIPGTSLLAVVLAALGFGLIAASFVQPSAMSLDRRAVLRSQGITRITRHPLFMGLALWGIAHLLVNGFLSDFAFFGGFAAFSVIGASHQDARKQAEHPRKLGPFFDETSLLPFVAILRGRNRLVTDELPWPAVGAGVALAIVVYFLHPVLFY